MAAGVDKPARGFVHRVGASVPGRGDDLAVVVGARPTPEQFDVAGRRPARGRWRAEVQRLALCIVKAGSEFECPVVGVRAGGLWGDVTRLVYLVLAGLCKQEYQRRRDAAVPCPTPNYSAMRPHTAGLSS